LGAPVQCDVKKCRTYVLHMRSCYFTQLTGRVFCDILGCDTMEPCKWLPNVSEEGIACIFKVSHRIWRQSKFSSPWKLKSVINKCVCWHSFQQSYVSVNEIWVSHCEGVDVALLRCNASFRTEDGGSTFLRNVGIHLQVHTTLQPRRLTSVFFSSSLKVLTYALLQVMPSQQALQATFHIIIFILLLLFRIISYLSCSKCRQIPLIINSTGSHSL
jgi:hypothetical protein